MGRQDRHSLFTFSFQAGLTDTRWWIQTALLGISLLVHVSACYHLKGLLFTHLEQELTLLTYNLVLQPGRGARERGSMLFTLYPNTLPYEFSLYHTLSKWKTFISLAKRSVPLLSFPSGYRYLAFRDGQISYLWGIQTTVLAGTLDADLL